MANEKRLIDANRLAKIAEKRCGVVNIKHIDDCPTIDAVPVVYCKDCIRSKRCKTRFFLEGYHRIQNPFCAAGERREGE